MTKLSAPNPRSSLPSPLSSVQTALRRDDQASILTRVSQYLAKHGDRGTKILKRSLTLIALSTAAFSLCAVSAQAGCYQPGGKPSLHPVIMPRELLGKSEKPAGSNSIVGLWHTSHFVDGSLLFDSLDQWFGDGNELEFANIAPATGDLCLGVWTMSGKSVSLWHTGWTFNPDGSSSGTMVLTESLKVSTDGTTFKGPFDVKFYDVDGNLLNDLSGKTTAERLPGN